MLFYNVLLHIAAIQQLRPLTSIGVVIHQPVAAPVGPHRPSSYNSNQGEENHQVMTARV